MSPLFAQNDGQTFDLTLGWVRAPDGEPDVGSELPGVILLRPPLRAATPVSHCAAHRTRIWSVSFSAFMKNPNDRLSPRVQILPPDISTPRFGFAPDEG